MALLPYYASDDEEELLFPLWRRPRNGICDENISLTVSDEKERVQLVLDLQNFSSDKVSVNTSRGFVIVEGKHEEKPDLNGFASRQFSRRYELPKDCPSDMVQCRMSSDGILTVIAPRKRKIEQESSERIVNIELVGPQRKRFRTEDCFKVGMDEDAG